MNNRNNHFIISAMTFIVMLFCQGLVSVNYAQTALFTESFENGGSIPPGWAVETVTAGNNVSFIASSSWPAGYLAYNGTYFVRFNSFEAGSGVMRLKKTTPVSTVGYTNVLVDFAWLESSGYAGSSDRVEVQWSTNGTTWSTAGTFERYNAIQGWKIKSQVLPVAAEGQPSVYIAFLFTSAYGNDCYLDLAHIKAVGPAPPSTITVGSGTVSCIYPYLTYWMAGRTQLLYTAAQLSSSGAPPGTITSIGFNVYSASASVMNQFNIRIGNTTDATITGWVTSGMQTCYSGTYSVPGTGWQMITLQTPFVYTGNNLIVEVCFTNLVFSAYSYVYGTTAPAGQIYPYWMDNITGCAYTGDPYTGYTGLPNLRFVEVPYTGHLAGTVTSCYNGTPLSGATVTCGTVSGTTSVTGNYGLYNIPVGTYTANYTMSGYLPASAPGTVISNNITTTKDVCLNPIPGYLSGVVTSAVTGNPVIGAKIMVGTSYAYSTGPNGAYTVSVYPVGTFGATFSKAGFDNNSTGPYTFTQNNTITQNCALLENLNAPVNVTAALNGGQTAINLSWGTPNGNYELLYDDGIQEGFQIWSVAGSYNAVKFTANGFPCTLNGGKINIGSQSSYPAGSNPLVTFQFLVFDATGTGGTPGTQIAGPFDFTPTSYGWNNFTFSSPVTISGSSFFIVQRQGGNNPNAAGIGIDATSNQLRSYLRFMPSGGWVNATGNFMMRALVYGPGGPSPLMLLSNDGNPVQDGTDRELIGVPGSQNRTESIKPYGGNESHDNQDNAAVVTGYQAWRLLQGQEGTPASWVSVGTPTEPSVIDNSWGTLPCNPYRWAVKTQYTGNRWSGAAFSNAVGKCWTAAVTVNANLSCPGASPAYATVRLQNTVYVDTIYLATLGSSGTCTFPQVWKGTYSLTVSRFGYSNYVNPAITIMGNTTINLNLLQIKTPPSNVQIDNQRLLATWIPPKLAVSIFAEDWSSGSFVTNGWATSGGTNWQISSGAGNPAPSATFSYNPVVTDYNQFLTSPNMTGLHSPVMTLKYDIYLSNYSTPNTNNLSVELWNGSAWIVLRTYSNSGDIAWTSETLDISAYTHNVIRIRFHAYGSDSYTINNWNIDNIAVVASDVGPDPCLQGYSFYLNGGLTAITGDTNYTIPGGLAPYGQSLA